MGSRPERGRHTVHLVTYIYSRVTQYGTLVRVAHYFIAVRMMGPMCMSYCIVKRHYLSSSAHRYRSLSKRLQFHTLLLGLDLQNTQ